MTVIINFAIPSCQFEHPKKSLRIIVNSGSTSAESYVNDLLFVIKVWNHSTNSKIGGELELLGF